MDSPWDEYADVVVVGFGAAGTCAAIEAAEHGASVVAVDRFGGGGATAMSGGVVYAGGGTAQQRAAGVPDTPEAMFGYLRHEVGDAVSAPTLRRFCAGSAAMVEWLAERGVPFEGSLCPDKTSYPTNRYYLYHSGSELSYADQAPPAPRGHRTRGRGTSGRLFYARLAAAALARGVRLHPQTRAVRLLTDHSGRTAGVECRTLRTAPSWARVAHRLLHRLTVKPGLYLPALARGLAPAVTWLERRYGHPWRVAARRGVVLCAGGFIANREMLRAHAPAYRGGLPLGTAGDDGSGIRLGTDLGGDPAHLDRVTVWRFLTPPSALLQGILVDVNGRRICDESRYGAAIGEAIVRSPGRRAWLLVDDATLRAARRQVRTQTLWFQRLQAWWVLTFDRVGGPTPEAAARRAGVAPDGLRRSLDEYHRGGPDPLGKPAGFVRRLDRPPYWLIDCAVRPRLGWPAPMLTLGGLRVDEDTGEVRRADGGVLPGLYAAGRTAVGVCSHSYVSGLSLADCVFAGRRAGRHAAFPVPSVPDQG